ncbi:uncharacterized protein LOC113510243 [Galleria mellonella]|uniref:Uncharacterized protein LOC113510243 n=1 Tax=Galleria mellonella TaxID=7137 RepID=A0A6J1W923_GALME|nr:uncharacterized protein LOC113510243 [Galleria mellonella]
MSSYSLDVEMFISEVKKYPEIWDLHNEDYRFKNKKQRAWAEIARVFITDFDDMPEIDKIDVYRKLHGKWRNIRDSFVRHVKKKDGKRGYLYAAQLSFLNDIYKPSDCSDEDLDNNESWQSDADDSHGFKKISLKRRLNLLTDSNIWPSDGEDGPPSTIENLKRKRSSKNKKQDIEYVDTPYIDASASTYQIEDEDRSFFESLLPVVRRFDVDQKLEFRSEILGLIKNIRSNNIRKFQLDPTTGDFND